MRQKRKMVSTWAREETSFLRKKVINAIWAKRNGNPKLSRNGIVKDILVVSTLRITKKHPSSSSLSSSLSSLFVHKYGTKIK